MPYFCFHGFSFTPAKLCLLGAITSFTSRFQTFDVFTFQLLQSTVAGSVGSGSLFVLSCRPLAAPSALLCCLGREKKCFLCTAQNEVLGLRERWGYKAAFVCSLVSASLPVFSNREAWDQRRTCCWGCLLPAARCLGLMQMNHLRKSITWMEPFCEE